MENELDKRIREIMDSLHLNQQAFSNKTGIASAALSNIFAGRTRPTLAHVHALKRSLPNLNTDWLLYGEGDMFIDSQDMLSSAPSQLSGSSDSDGWTEANKEAGNSEPLLPFDAPYQQQKVGQNFHNAPNITPKNTPSNAEAQMLSMTSSRKITEIRVFYDDQTWESFMPKK